MEEYDTIHLLYFWKLNYLLPYDIIQYGNKRNKVNQIPSHFQFITPCAIDGLCFMLYYLWYCTTYGNLLDSPTYNTHDYFYLTILVISKILPSLTLPLSFWFLLPILSTLPLLISSLPSSLPTAYLPCPTLPSPPLASPRLPSSISKRKFDPYPQIYLSPLPI